MMIALVVLTLTGFVIVSRSLVPKTDESGRSSLAGSTPQSTPRRSPSASPALSGKKQPLSERQMAAALSEAQQLLDQMESAVSLNDWSKAKSLFSEFRDKAEQLPAPQLHSSDPSLLLQDFYDLYAVSMERALTEKNARSAMMALNQLYGIIGEHRARLESRSALELQRLRFLVRELEFWSAANDEKMLEVRAAALRAVWRDVRPVVIARRGNEPAVRSFDQLIDQLAAARQVRELNALLPEFKKQIEQIESLLQASQKQNSASSDDDDDER
jgi:hypothetical protein